MGRRKNWGGNGRSFGALGRVDALPGCTKFFFRVRQRNDRGECRTFDTCVYSRPTLAAAFHSLSICYPGAEISALQETDFDTDGLPKLNIRTNERVGA